MNAYSPIMIIAERVRRLRQGHALTQDDLAAKSGVSLATIQRIERGATVSPGTIASLAAAFDMPASELTAQIDGSVEPYLSLKPILTGRSLVALVRASQRLDLEFVELDDLGQAELIQELQEWTDAQLRAGVPSGALALAKLELDAGSLLKRMTEAKLNVAGATYKIDIYEVDDEFDAMPVILAQWDQRCAVVRIGIGNDWIDRAYVMDQLGKWETPAPGELIHPETSVA